jgi:metal-sulfur cluster biosynthetic enzyme
MNDRPDTAAAAVTPHSTSDERPTIVDDSISEERAIPLSVATGEESADTPGVVSEDQVKLALRRVKDPDLNLNILDLGLVYGIEVKGTKVKVDMTLTSPGCPSGPEIMGNAEEEIKSLPGVESVEMNLVWMPFWTPEKMEPRVRAYLGF